MRVLTPALMVLLFMTNDFLAMSLTTDRASPAPSPSVWRMRNITAAAVVLGAMQARVLHGDAGGRKIPTRARRRESCRRSAFVTLVFGNQAVLYVLRERRRMWSSKPSNWVLGIVGGGYRHRLDAGAGRGP